MSNPEVMNPVGILSEDTINKMQQDHPNDCHIARCRRIEAAVIASMALSLIDVVNGCQKFTTDYDNNKTPAA